MTKSELIEALAGRQSHLAFNDVELAVKNALEQMSQALARGERIEIRGFGSFSLHFRPPRMGRNPKTGTRRGVARQIRAALQARQGTARARERDCALAKRIEAAFAKAGRHARSSVCFVCAVLRIRR